MNSMEQQSPRELIAGALPGEFTFYHLGQVSPQSGESEALPSSLSANGLQAVGFSLYGEMRGLAIVLFDEGLDTSTYTELGNTLASRLADGLSDQSAKSDSIIMVSPPMPLSETQYSILTQQGEPITRTYLHPQSDGTITEIHLAVWRDV